MTAAEHFGLLAEKFPARCSEKHKSAFLDYAADRLTDLGYEVAVREEGGARNLLAGNVSESEIVLSAHYDTAIRSASSFYSTVEKGLAPRIRQRLTGFWSGLTRTGGENPNNANDNTSGVAALLAVADERSPRTCFLLTDGEENGSRGSAAFCRAFAEEMETRLFLALDCIGVGKDVGAIYYRAYNAGYAAAVAERFTEGEYVGFAVQPRGIFPTDAELFPKGVCVSSFLRDGKGRRYFTDVHTVRDRAIDEGNLDFVAGAVMKYIKEILQ